MHECEVTKEERQATTAEEGKKKGEKKDGQLRLRHKREERREEIRGKGK